VSPKPLQEGMSLRQILAVGALPLKEVRNRVQPQTVDTEPEPEVNDLENLLLDLLVVIVQVGLGR